MGMIRAASLVIVCATFLTLIGTAAEAARRTPKEALQAFNDLIGSWKATGQPNGTQAEKQKGFWQEKIAWEWRFKGADVWLSAVIDKGKYFTSAELRYSPDKDVFVLKVTTPGKEILTFEGPLEKRRLIVERHDEAKNEDQRLVWTLLHFNRHLYRYETRPATRPAFKAIWEVGATKEGVDFASTDDGPECVVSGGLGTIPVSYQGTTYYVCCTGCRDAFKEEPEKYIKEFEARKKKKHASADKSR
jgi:hypothetical protein